MMAGCPSDKTSQNEHIWIWLGSLSIRSGTLPSGTSGVMLTGACAELLQQLCLGFMKKLERHGLKYMTYQGVERESC